MHISSVFCVCVCVCVYVCMCGVCVCVRVCVCGDVTKMATRGRRPVVQGTRRASDTVPIGDGCRFCPGSDPSTIKPSKSFASLDLHSSIPPYHHTPWGPSSWQSDRSTLTASSGYGDQSTRHASMACFYGHGAQLPLTPGFFRHGPGQPTLMTVFGLRNRPCPTLSWARRPEDEVCVCASVFAYVCLSLYK